MKTSENDAKYSNFKMGEDKFRELFSGEGVTLPDLKEYSGMGTNQMYMYTVFRQEL